MNPTCAECKEEMGETERAGILLAKKKGTELQNGPGYIIHYEHVQEISSKLHKLEEMADGIVFVIDQRQSPSSEPKIIGYLSPTEAKKYFPRTEAKLIE